MKNRILQISQGFSYAWSKSAHQGRRRDAASIKIDGKPLNPDGLYRVTINSFLTDGGDEFSIFENGAQRMGDGSDLEAFVAYLGAYPLIALRLGGHISLSP